MQLGAVFPQSEIGNDPAVIRDFAQGVESLGFTHLLIYDHVLGADPNRPGVRPAMSRIRPPKISPRSLESEVPSAALKASWP